MSDKFRPIPRSWAILALCTAPLLVGCKEDPLKDWSNSKLHAKSSSCAKTKKHTPRSGLICNQVKESCAFRGLNCK